MIAEKKLTYHQSVIVQQFDNWHVLLNRDNGKWVRLRPKVAHSLERAIKEETTAAKYLNGFSYELQPTLEELLNNLLNAQILTQDGIDELARSFEVYFMVTERCNLGCKTCALPARPLSSGIDTPTRMIIAMLDRMLASKLIHTIIFTGGEPLVREDMVDIIAYAAGFTGFRFVLQTNGTLLSKSICKRIGEVFPTITVEVSLDGVDEKTSAEIRGPAAFTNAMKGISNLQEEGITDIITSMILSKHNMAIRDDFKKLNEKLDTKYVMRRFMPFGRGMVNRNLLEPVKNNATMVDDRSRGIEELKKSGISKEEIMKLGRREQKAATCCGAGISELAVLSNGNIYPCPNMIREEMLLGNVLQGQQLERIMREPEKQRVLEQLSIDSRTPCKNCDMRYFCSYCLAEIYNRNETLDAVTQNCEWQKKYITALVLGEN